MRIDETWKSVPGYEGRYEVSDLGRVRSLDRGWIDPLGRSGHRKGALLKQQPNNWGYRIVKLYSGAGAKRSWNVAHLVIAAFVGPRPNGMQVCHDDGNAGNSVLQNLRYDTPEGNQADRVRHGTHLRGERHPRTHLMDDDVRQISMMKGMASLRAIAEVFGVSGPSMSNIMNGKSWRHLL